jgi:hypothetical protein
MSLTVHKVGRKGLVDGDIKELRATEFYLVRSNAGPVSVVAAAAASGLPTYYDSHDDNAALKVKSIRGRNQDEENSLRDVWEMQLDYSSLIDVPLDTAAEFEWDFSESSEDYFVDADGATVVNSAGQAFDSIPTRETGAISLTITKNVAADFDTSTFLSFRQTTNDSGFTVDGVSIDTCQAKFSGANVSPVKTSNGVAYRTVKMVLKFKESWLDEFSDFGYYGLDTGFWKPIATDGSLIEVPDDSKQMVQKPWPLDGSGSPQAAPDDDPASITARPYVESDYGDLSALFS